MKRPTITTLPGSMAQPGETLATIRFPSGASCSVSARVFGETLIVDVHEIEEGIGVRVEGEDVEHNEEDPA